MSHPADIAARTQRFNEAARTLTPPAPTRHAKLMPMKDGIIELRQKGASLRLIRELLATVGVAVGTDTIARFLAEVDGESQSLQTSKGSARVRRARRGTTTTQLAIIPAATSTPPPPQNPSSNSVTTVDTDKPTERSRVRGPRIADPHNL